ncbi:DUF4097 family beta strand repeat-containing protein [Streptosporangium sp. CA-135522]|uniref:DUF4097 family beta strand repeat-containing protein n=1 Tax=Streptosporangium sp. CA-135522 TaxID=3240072 RepID=UPI003D8E5119
MKKNMIVAGMLLGSALVLSACRIDLDLGEQAQEVASYDVTGDLKVLDVHTGSGDIVVNGSDRTGARVTETLHWRGEAGDKPVTEHSVNGGTLTLRHRCPVQSCSVDYKIEISKGLSAKLDTGSGTLTMRALTGEVKAKTGSGRVEAAILGTGRFVAETGSGDIEAKFAATPDHVEVRTGSGDATVRLPQGAYDVTAETGSGVKTVQVTDDPSASRSVRVRTGSGDARVLHP